MNRRDYLQDPDVNLWYEGLKEGSEQTADHYLRWLAVYCDHRGLAPNELISEFKRDNKVSQDELQRFIVGLSKQMSPNSRHLILSSVKSWFRNSDILIARKIKTGNMNSTPTLVDERVPTQEELRSIINHANIRTRAAISLIAFAGIRFGAISGLVLSDLADIKIENGKVVILKEPMRINVRAELSKNGMPYFTWLIKEGCDYLKSYFDSSQTLTLDSPVIGVGENTKAFGHFSKKGSEMSSKTIAQAIRNTMRSAGFKARPYILRSYFATALQNGKVTKSRRDFYAGHKGDMEETYTNRHSIVGKQEEEMRAEFKESAEPELTTLVSVRDPRETMRTALIVDGNTPEAVTQMLNGMPANTDWSKTTKADVYRNATKSNISFFRPDEDIRKEADKQAKSRKRLQRRFEGGSDASQIVVSSEEAKERIADGWRWTGNLPSGEVVLER